jgi:hypothetical protein
MNNIAISPHILMYALQNQNVEHKIVKKIDISMLNTGSVAHEQNDNGNRNENDNENNKDNKDNINTNTNLLDSSNISINNSNTNTNANSSIMGAELALSSSLITDTFDTSESGTTNISDI